MHIPISCQKVDCKKGKAQIETITRSLLRTDQFSTIIKEALTKAILITTKKDTLKNDRNIIPQTSAPIETQIITNRITLITIAIKEVSTSTIEMGKIGILGSMISIPKGEGLIIIRDS